MEAIQQRSYDDIAQEIARAFGLPLDSLPVQTTALAFYKLLMALSEPIHPERHVYPPDLFIAVRNETYFTALEILHGMLGIFDNTATQEAKYLYHDYLTRIRECMDEPAPDVANGAACLSPEDRLKRDTQLFRHAWDAMRLCWWWKRMQKMAQA